MLGKLIKNEFVQRGRQLLLLLGGELIIGVLLSILEIICNTLNDDSIIYTLLMISSVALYIALFGGVVGIVLLTFKDFSNRLFKDQGYLTHTLPVKISSIMLSRIVCDIATIMATMIVFPLSLSIAFRDFTFYKEIQNYYREICIQSNIEYNGATLTIVGIMTAIGLFASALVCIWHFNASYAIGHSFGSCKRLMSVVAYIAFYIIGSTLMYLLGLFLDYLTFNTNIINTLNELVPSAFVGYILAMSCFILIEAIAIAIFTAITSIVCKKHLNLE